MDNIKKLMNHADPATRDDIGEPGPLNLEERVPVFAQKPATHMPAKRSNKWRIFVTGAVAVAVSVGIIVWSPWKIPAPPMPAGPTNLTPNPTPSSGIDESVLPKVDYGLPNFLVPAHQDVYFQNSEACNSLDLETLRLIKPNGTVTTLPNNVNAYPIVGCLDGFASILSTELSFANGYNPGGSAGIYIAKWDDGQWSINESDNPGVSTSFGFPLMSWPELRARGNPRNPLTNPDQPQRFKDMGIPEQSLERLLGPDIPSWMGTKRATVFNDFGNEQFTLTYPVQWQMQEQFFDEGSDVPLAETKEDLAKIDRYDLKFFDERGKQVLYLISINKGTIFEPTDCSIPERTYRLDGQSASGLVSDKGPMQLALITFFEGNGNENSRLGIFPANLPATGKACDVRLGVDAGTRTLFTTELVTPMGFKDQAERDAYIKSPEYAEIKKVAASLSLTPPQG